MIINHHTSAYIIIHHHLSPSIPIHYCTTPSIIIQHNPSSICINSDDDIIIVHIGVDQNGDVIVDADAVINAVDNAADEFIVN